MIGPNPALNLAPFGRRTLRDKSCSASVSFTLCLQTMIKSLTILLFLVLPVGGQLVLAKTINLPTIPLEVAVETAKKYVLEKKIDVGDAFIGVVEYHNLHNEYERPYWRVRWVRKIGAKGGWFELRILSDDSIEERPGK